VRAGDVVFFGDSVLREVSLKDRDARTLPDLLAAFLPEARLAVVSHDGFQPRMFAALADHLFRSGRRPACILVSINLRAFSPSWAERPSWLFANDIALLRLMPGPGDEFARLRLAYGEWPPAAPDPPHERYALSADLPGLRRRFPAQVYEPQSLALADLARLYYLVPLAPGHPNLEALVELRRRAVGARVPVLFYLTPLDVGTATAQLGEPFRGELAAKARTFREALKGDGSEFADLSAMLPSEAFKWREEGTFNEHLSARGRRPVARRLAALLRALMRSGARPAAVSPASAG
jgi:hypothetical protein